jgi:hypothetical protein
VILALALAAALAAGPGAASEPICVEADFARLVEPPERLAVAWVGRWRREPRGALRVVPAADLARWVAEQEPAWEGRTLQRLGIRRRNTDPKRRYKVVIFDVPSTVLCRPVLDVAVGEIVAGMPSCSPRFAKPRRDRTACGATLDRRSGEPGLTALVVRRRDAIEGGHCSVPLDRYIRRAGR